VRRTTRLLAPLLALGLLIAGCSVSKNQVTPDASAAPTGSVTSPALGDGTGVERFYNQVISWSTCESGRDCATVVAPVDWANPDGDTVDLAIERESATGGNKIGSLLINPGGPGSSGIDALDFLTDRIGKSVRAEYDIIGFDPRGVQRSSPITCLPAAQMDTLLSTDFNFDTDAGLAEASAAYADFAAACGKNTGPILAHVDTQSTAHDMDLIRAVLGDEKLNYLGFSYGTQLGTTYAAMFPDKVGRMVLDGALDPSLSDDEITVGQAVGFESALRAYVADCQGGKGCPLTGSVDDGMKQIATMLQKAKLSPLPTGESRKVTGALAFTGIAVTLYDQGSWSYLTQALTEAIETGNGSTLLMLADIYYDRDTDGSYKTNSTEAFYGINCADDRPDATTSVMRDQAARIMAEAPTVGPYFGYGALVCANWPTPPVAPITDYSAKGAAPIVVVGTTNDPATPYVWAQSLAKTLSSAVLLTFKGEGHTAYGNGNACLDDAVNAYLADGTVPEDGLTCG